MIARRTTLGLGAAALLVAATGCEEGSARRENILVVFAAASLRDVFAVIADDFRRDHPGVDVRVAYAGTHELRAQLEHGAQADVFVSADERHMDALRHAGLVEAPVVIARNELVVVVGNTAADTIATLDDLPLAGRLVVGTGEVPIGRYTAQLLERAAAVHGADFRARVEARIVSRELDARQVLAKVVLGEAEAGIVYRTDARSAGAAVRVVGIPPAIGAFATYPAAIVEAAAHPALARAWLDLLLSDRGQAALHRAGFLAP